MERCYKYLDTLIYAILVMILVVMLVVGGMQVFWRYLLSNSLSWSEELLRYLYIWATMLGICMGIRVKALAVVSSFTEFIAKKSEVLKNILVIINFIIQIGLFVILAIYGWELSMKTMGQVSASMKFLKMGIVYLALPVGSVLALIYTFDEIHTYFKMEKDKSLQ
ncbi:MAG: TRAP transporter small permease [Peptococcaceae bacterium]